MSLVLKCQCGMILKYDIRSPGLVVVAPCEDCRQRMEDLLAPTVAGAGVSAVDSVKLPGDAVEGPVENAVDELFTRVERMRKANQTAYISGGDDDNDPKNPVDRRLA